MRIKNPCRGLCQLNDDQICVGCGRTQQQRNDWLYSTVAEQAQISQEAAEQLTVLARRNAQDENA